MLNLYSFTILIKLHGYSSCLVLIISLKTTFPSSSTNWEPSLSSHLLLYELSLQIGFLNFRGTYSKFPIRGTFSPNHLTVHYSQSTWRFKKRVQMLSPQINFTERPLAHKALLGNSHIFSHSEPFRFGNPTFLVLGHQLAFQKGFTPKGGFYQMPPNLFWGKHPPLET